MAYSADEQRALNFLGAKDFRSVGKAQLTAAFSNGLSTMDKDVALAIVKNIPDFMTNMLAIVDAAKAATVEAVKADKDALDIAVSGYNNIQEALKTLMQDENLTFDQKKEIYKMMMEVQSKVDEQVKEHRKAVQEQTTRYFAILGVIAAGITTAVGVNAYIKR